MNIHFQLDRPRAKRSTIMLTYRHRGFRFRYSTGYSVVPANWDKSREREISKIGTSIINSRINALQTAFERMMMSFLSGEGRHPSRHEMKEYLDRHYREKRNPPVKKVEKDSPCLIRYFERLLQLWATNGRIKASSVKAYNRSLNIMKAALKDTLPVDQLGEEAIATIVHYMRGRKDEDSYIKKTLEHIKTFINYAILDDSLPTVVENPVQTKAYGLKDRPSEKIYLTKDEVIRIADLDLSSDQRKDIVRDNFLFAVHTGQRYCDLDIDKWELGVTEEGRHYLKYRSTKSDILSMLPLKQAAFEILQKYPNGMPTRSNTEINRMIKQIGFMAGIDQIVTRTEYRGDELTIRSPKYSQIETHTARRTFCTLAVRDGVPTNIIMAMSGHATESSFRRYVRHSKHEAMQDALKYDFFK
ncbi:MAG: tyrosine-type recombinase/integrase [Lewinellaceae bacterium]|nr:tyrosine-type recombinase/integrase [Lewinellaceae bacterium]